MQREFIYTKLFHEAWSALGLADKEQRELELFLLDHPDAGDVIEHTGGLRKVRWALPSKGKSGGIRVLYADFKTYGLMLMVMAYPKGKKDNITDEEKATIKAMLANFKHILQGG